MPQISRHRDLPTGISLGGDQAEMAIEIKEETRMSKSGLVKTETMSPPVAANHCPANVLETKVCIDSNSKNKKQHCLCDVFHI